MFMFEIKQIDKALEELSNIQSWCEFKVRRSKDEFLRDVTNRYNHGCLHSAEDIANIVESKIDGLKAEREKILAEAIRTRSVIAIALSITAIICCIILKARL